MEEKTLIKEIEKAAAEKAWELARIILEPPSRGGMGYDDMLECFGIPRLESTTAVFRMPYEEVRKKYNTWLKEHRKVIRIGDEVEFEASGIKMVVTKMQPVSNDEFGPILDGISSDGSVHVCRFSDVVKTGNHWAYLDDYYPEFSGWAT